MPEFSTAPQIWGTGAGVRRMVGTNVGWGIGMLAIDGVGVAAEDGVIDWMNEDAGVVPERQNIFSRSILKREIMFFSCNCNCDQRNPLLQLSLSTYEPTIIDSHTPSMTISMTRVELEHVSLSAFTTSPEPTSCTRVATRSLEQFHKLEPSDLVLELGILILYGS